jgi:L-rhamnose mutarotase
VKCFGYTLNLKDDVLAIEAYKEYHRRVWPEIEQMLKSHGVTKLRIFLEGRRLFLYLEAGDDYDPNAAAEEYMRDSKCAEWEELMRSSCQEQLPGSAPGEWWRPTERIYALDYPAPQSI